MRKLVMTVFVALALPSAWGATYTYVGLPYSTEIAYFQNYTPPCTTGNCATYTVNMQVTGYIDTTAPVPANQTNLDITSSITSFSFSDGVHTFANTDPSVLAPRPFIASTDAMGNITSLSVVLARWQSNVVPHAVGSRLDYVELGGYNAGLNLHYDQGETNNYCATYVSVNDSCSNITVDSNSSRGVGSPLGIWTTAALGLNQHGLTGSWYQPTTNGQGLEVEVFPDQVAPGTGSAFVSWFTYDTAAGGADHQRWYTLQGHVVSGQPNAALTIYQNVGGNFNALPVTNGQAVGTATLSFDSCSSGKLMYTFSDGTGRAGSIALTRLTPNVTCSTTSPYPTNADFAHSGNWFAAATSGQGFTVDFNPSSGLFMAWYTYAPGGAAAGAAGQRWYTAQAGAFAPGTRSIPVQIYQTTGGMFDAPTAPTTVQVGTGTLTFQSCTAATFNYNFTGGSSSGLSGTITLSRVGPVPPGCTQ